MKSNDLVPKRNRSAVRQVRLWHAAAGCVNPSNFLTLVNQTVGVIDERPLPEYATGVETYVPDSIYETFGKLVRRHRRGLEGMTQAELGRRIGLSRTSITNIEQGRQPVSLHQFLLIAHALRVPPEALLPRTSTDEGKSNREVSLPEGTEPDIVAWAHELLGRRT